MDLSIYIKHDPWWDREYSRLSIKNYMRIPIFYKLYQLEGDYKYTFVNIEENFICNNVSETLEIHTLDNKFKELANRNIPESTWFYYKLHQHPEYVQEIESNLTTHTEYGTEKRTFNEDVWEVWTWNKTSDILSEKEHFPGQKTELFTLELSLEKSELINSKVKKTSRKSEFSFYSFEQTEIITSENSRIEIREKIQGDLVEKSTIDISPNSKTINKSKDTRGFVEEIYEYSNSYSGYKILKKKITARIGIHVLTEVVKEKAKKHSGLKSFKNEQKELEIKWKIVENQFLCEIIIKNGPNILYSKKITKDETRFIEIDYFKSGTALWGNIKDYSEDGSMSMNWRVREPNIYNTYIQNYSICKEFRSENSPNEGLYALLNLVKFEADFIFDVFENISDSNIDVFSGLTMHLFSEQSPAFDNLNENFDNYFEKLYDYLEYRNDFNDRFDEQNFLKFLRNFKELNIQQIYRKEKMLSFVLESVKDSKKILYCNEFIKNTYFELLPFIFKLLHSVLFKRTFASRYDQPSFKVAKKELVDSDTLNLYCTVCNTVCLLDCKVSETETELNSPCNVKCLAFSGIKSRTNCKFCLRSCSPNYHFIVRKSIITTEVNFETTEFNKSQQLAEEDQRNLSKSLKSSNLLPVLFSKLEHFIILTKKRLKTKPNDQNLQEDLINWKEVLTVVNNYGA